MARRGRKAQPRRKAPAVSVRGGWDVLPHNMGLAPSAETKEKSLTTEGSSNAQVSSIPEAGSTGKGPSMAKAPPVTINVSITEIPSIAEAAPTKPTISGVATIVQEPPAEARFSQTTTADDEAAPQGPAHKRIIRSKATKPVRLAKSLNSSESLHAEAKTTDEKPNPVKLETHGTQQTRWQLRPRKAKITPDVFTTALTASSPGAEVEATNEQNDNRAANKRSRRTIAASIEDGEVNTDDTEPKPKKARRKARKTKDNPYGLTPGESPFPKWQAPSMEQCAEVYELLREMHDDVPAQAPDVIPAPSLEVTGCGEVPSVLDALIRTYISGAVTFNGAARMLDGLVKKFGILEDGIGKGSVNWNNVRLSSPEDVVNAIRAGGLANIKAKHIKAILDMVHQENVERREAYLEERKTGEQATVFAATEKTDGQKDLEILKTDQNILSLDHLHGLPVDEAMRQLTKYPGIGVKTSACVILFCLQRPCFAVDTHVNKFAKWLGWAPEKATEDDVFSHLEVRCPDRLKYGLHQLFIRHGQTCGKCKRSTAEGTDDWKALDDCPLEALLRRFDKRQSRAKPKPPKKGRGTNVEKEQEEDAMDES
ncbi:DNA glycosylase [Hypoxylon crocopeplum]|nr:DNA glycosylase [Hypoxylon crocopeplum]